MNDYVSGLRKMQSLVWRVGLCLATSVGIVFVSSQAIASEVISAIADFSSTEQNDASDVQNKPITLLRFETQHYIVRIFQEYGLTYLNVYNKETGFTDKNRALAMLAEPENEEDHWLTYINQQGDLEYRARVNPSGSTELEIRIVDGPPDQPEVGFNATYSFPHRYLGADIEATVLSLSESGWSVSVVAESHVELTRNELSLNFTFESETGLITHTELIN